MPVSKQTAAELTKPYWRSECGRAVVYVGDCREVLARLEPEQFHAVVTDPPYGLEFDVGQVVGDWDAPWKGESNKVNAKTRRANEMNDPIKAQYLRHNVEYIRDGLAFQEWFHKCACDILRSVKPGAHILSFGGTRMWHRMACAIEDAGWEIRDTLMWIYGSGYPKGRDISKAVDALLGAERQAVGVMKNVPDTTKVRPGFTGAAHMGDASGSKRDVAITAPATEAAQQWDGWNTTLKPAVEPIVLARKPMGMTSAQCVLTNGTGAINVKGCEVNGRWPANVIFDGSDGAIKELPEGACRYFYTAKAGDDDRPHGRGAIAHPTVKPLDLMQYLVRLVCALGGKVLDPFMGSGSTGCAAMTEGMSFVGIEKSREYADIAVGRLRLALAAQNTPPSPKRLRGT